MQKLVELKARMRTVANIQGVARTMATVASAKLSRTRRKAAGMREYAARVERTIQRQIAITRAQGQDPAAISPFFAERDPVKLITLLHIAGDRGMCGNYNVAANRLALEAVAARRAEGQEVAIIAKGAKGERFFARKAPGAVIRTDTWPRAGVVEEEVAELRDLLVQRFLTGEADEVWCTYTRYYSPIRRQPRMVRLLPLGAVGEGGPTAGGSPAAPAGAPDAGTAERWSYEPGFAEILTELVEGFIRARVEDLLMESYASEQGARMIAMEEATERAGRALAECRVLYNRLRREVITTDLLGVLFAAQVTEGEEGGEDG
jgi:F-type H+-transporting ATPase subunit gamma